MNAHERLAKYGEHLPEKDKAFARSIWLATRDGAGSDKQHYWLVKMADRAEQAATPNEGMDQGLSAIHDMFGVAKQGLRRPSFKIDGLKLYVAGPRSKYAGQIMIVALDDDEYQGRIDGDLFFPGRNVHVDTLRTLTAIADDPAGAAADHGRRTGNCCFCSRDLTDDRSVTVGYGPVCASKWGLPWGSQEDAA